MEANELRIGNILNAKMAMPGLHDNFEVIDCGLISQLSKYGACFNENGLQFPFELIKPIPLIEDWWLLKFGLQKVEHRDYEYYLLKQETYAIIIDHGRYVMVWDYESDRLWSILQEPIQYVHQLQNLYFALTGEELTIKETV